MIGFPPDSVAAAQVVAATLWRQRTGVQDTLTPHRSVVDSVVIESPLPDPLVPVVQWLFQKPGWLMLGGMVLGLVAAIVLAVVVWRRRHAIKHWLTTRERGVKLALGGGVGVVLLLMTGFGWKSYDFMMHDNDFCKGCHIFVPSGRIMERPDTGTYLLVNALEGKHDSLSCHACHPFNLKAQTLELVAWMTERPDVVPPNHAKVPRAICEQCHVQRDPTHQWQRIASTAGHRAHLESDSLRGKVECLSCHALSAHRFAPTDSTCANQQGCHLNDDVRIRLGKMAGQGDLHCNTCHQFTKDVPALATRDSAAGALTPGTKQCASCHAMQEVLTRIGFDPGRDPHGGTCGMCHNPHTNAKPADAIKSCASAQCHADWRDVAFHSGSAHRRVAQQCQLCHAEHAARVDASDCTSCHESVRSGKRQTPGVRPRVPPAPFDTAEALRRSAVVPPAREPRGKGDAPLLPESAPAPLAADTFSHPQHKRLACTTCHDVRSRTNAVRFEQPRGCVICHHQPPTGNECATCHTGDEVRVLSHREPLTVQVRARDTPARTRDVTFAHDTHSSITCRDCHTTPVTLVAPEPVRTCRNCHEQHHTETVADCASCHRSETTWDGHARASHVQCSACHAGATVSRLLPNRPFCLSCHQPAVDHYAERECTECHMLEAPGAYRSQLSGR